MKIQRLDLATATSPAGPGNCDGCLFFTEHAHPLGEPPKKACFLVGDFSGLAVEVAKAEESLGYNCLSGQHIYVIRGTH